MTFASSSPARGSSSATSASAASGRCSHPSSCSMRGRIAAVVLAVFLGILVSHQVLYKLLLVPRLPAYHSVPIPVWFALTTPVLVAAVLGGMALRSWRETTLTSLLGGVAV